MAGVRRLAVLGISPPGEREVLPDGFILRQERGVGCESVRRDQAVEGIPGPGDLWRLGTARQLPLPRPIYVDEIFGIASYVVGMGHEAVQFAARLLRHDPQPLSPPLDLEGFPGLEHLIQQSVQVFAELGRGQSHTYVRNSTAYV